MLALAAALLLVEALKALGCQGRRGSNMSTDDNGARPSRRTLGEAIALGAGVGVALGVTQDNILLGIGVGVAIAAAVVTARRNRNKPTADPE
jgi:hypothetical protein